MSLRASRCLSAVCAAVLLGGAAASAAPGGPDHPGKGQGGPPPWAGQPGHPDKPGKGPKAEAPAAAVVAEPAPDPASAPGEATVPTLSDDTGIGVAAPGAAESGAPAAAARGRAEIGAPVRGKGRAKPAVFLVRATVEDLGEETLTVLVTGGNRRGRTLRGATLTIRPQAVIVGDEPATVADVWAGDQVVFQLRLPRTSTAADLVGQELSPRRVVDVSERDELPAPTDVPLPPEGEEPLPPSGEPAR